MPLTRRSFSLFLAMTPNIGGKSLTRIITRNELLNRSPEEFLRLSPEVLREEYRLTAKAAFGVLENKSARLKATEELEKKLSALNVFWITSCEAHYPVLLEEMDPDPPGVLFLHGNLRLFDSKTFCVLSSRDPKPFDLEQIEKLTQEGVLNGEVLVSGLNTPAYQRSAVVPLRWGAPRILCLDKGLFQALGSDLLKEPFAAARLWRCAFDPQTDLAVSAFRPDDPFIGKNNQVRDKLIACLSRRLDFVSISEGGNMQRLAKAALKAGRTVRVSDRILGYRAYVAMGAQPLPE